MRILVDGLNTVIEEEVIGSEPLDGVSGQYELEAAFTVQYNDGLASWSTAGWQEPVQVNVR